MPRKSDKNRCRAAEIEPLFVPLSLLRERRTGSAIPPRPDVNGPASKKPAAAARPSAAARGRRELL
mgnify:CR=1 FL=1